jgi:orotidine-5'-phosphate decarboxylase
MARAAVICPLVAGAGGGRGTPGSRIRWEIASGPRRAASSAARGHDERIVGRANDCQVIGAIIAGVPTFASRLDRVIYERGSLLCIGLDPDPASLPIADVAAFNRAIIDATADLVTAYKLQLAFYEALGLPGIRAMVNTIAYLRDHHPGVLVIGDGKRGDIGSTATAYARAMFEAWDFDATTVNVYQGSDAVLPFLDYGDRGVFVVCRTSNLSSREFQDRVLVPSGRPLYAAIADAAEAWNEHGNVGLVVGATFVDDIRALRADHPSLPFLVPAIGHQGGAPSSAAAAVTTEGAGAVLSASRSVLYASSDPNRFANAARAEATRLRDEMAASVRAVAAPT